MVDPSWLVTTVGFRQQGCRFESPGSVDVHAGMVVGGIRETVRISVTVVLVCVLNYFQVTSDLWPLCRWLVWPVLVCVVGRSSSSSSQLWSPFPPPMGLLCISGSDVTAWAAMNVIGYECGISIIMNAVPTALSVPSPRWHVWACPGHLAITSPQSKHWWGIGAGVYRWKDGKIDGWMPVWMLSNYTHLLCVTFSESQI